VWRGVDQAQLASLADGRTDTILGLLPELQAGGGCATRAASTAALR
jgi:hypothetical protein